MNSNRNQSKPHYNKSNRQGSKSQSYQQKSKPHFKNNQKPYPKSGGHQNGERSNFNKQSGKKFNNESRDSQQPFKTKQITKGGPTGHEGSLQHLPTIQQMLAIPK